MERLGIDVEQARYLAGHVLARGDRCDDVGALTAVLQAQASLVLDAPDLLHGLAQELRSVARMLLGSADTIDGHVMQVRPHPNLAITAAGQLASHNTYRSDRTVAELYRAGVTGFEFDLHGPARTGEWKVYHHALDPASNVASLADALDHVAALPPGAPLTVFLDLKDAPSNELDQRAFDETIRNAFGERLFTPLDLIMSSPGTTTVSAAAAANGWPTFGELSTQVLVIVTGDVMPYRSRARLTAAAFVAARPTPSAIVDPHIAVYNAPSTALSATEVRQLQESGGLVRTWGPPTAAGRSSNYLALDL